MSYLNLDGFNFMFSQVNFEFRGEFHKVREIRTHRTALPRSCDRRYFSLKTIDIETFISMLGMVVNHD